MLPLMLSVSVLLIGVILGAIWCNRLCQRIQFIAANNPALNCISVSYIAICLMKTAFFFPFEWKPQVSLWFALSPELERHWLGRDIRTAAQNWNVLQKNLIRRTLFIRTRRILGNAQRSNQIHPEISHQAIYDAQKILRRSGLDSVFSSAVVKSRKIMSGILSILVLCFVGTMTSALSVFLCEERDSMWFIAQEPTVECSTSSVQYVKLISIAIIAVLLYAVFVPMLVLLALKSRWSQHMRAHDRKAFEALFGFLTTRYSRACFMWELVVLLFKALSVIVPVLFADLPARACIFMIVISVSYAALVFNYSPFANAVMNFVEKGCHICVIIMYFSALIFACEAGGSPLLDEYQKSFVAIFLCIVCIVSSAMCVLASVYEHAFLLLFHNDIVISKWTQALQLAIGDCLQPVSNLFLYFYVYYNSSARHCIVRKKRKWNEEIAQLLLLEGTDDFDRAPWLLKCAMRFKRWFTATIFAIIHRGDLECDSASIARALQSPEAQLMQCFSKIEQKLSQKTMHEKSFGNTGGNCANSSFIMRLLQKLMFWKQVLETPQSHRLDTLSSGEYDPPHEFIYDFRQKHSFVCQSFSSTSISIWLTILLFQEEADRSQSQDQSLYMSRMVKQLGPLKQAVLSTFMVVQDVSHRDATGSNDHVSRSNLAHFLNKMYLNTQGVCLLRFANMSFLDHSEIFADKGFEDFSRHSMFVVPIRNLMAAQRQSIMEPATKKVLRIRDSSISNRMKPLFSQDEQTQQHLATIDHTNSPSFESSQSFHSGSHNMHRRGVLPSVSTRETHKIRPRVQSSLRARDLESDRVSTVDVQSRCGDGDLEKALTLKVQTLMNELLDMKSYSEVYQKRLEWAEKTISHLKLQNDELKKQLSLRETSFHRDAPNAASDSVSASAFQECEEFDLSNHSEFTEELAKDRLDFSKQSVDGSH
jgi:hypothetical protein